MKRVSRSAVITLALCCVLGLSATGCHEADTVFASTRRWTIVVIHENGQETGRFVSSRKPRTFDTGITVYSLADGHEGKVWNPRGITLVIPGEHAR